MFGEEAWYDLKESNHLPTWRKYAVKVLKAVKLAITDTVEICDQKWVDKVCSCLDRGIDLVNKMDEIDEIISVLAATMIEVSFWQVGFMPKHNGKEVKSPLRKGAWKLNRYRSVVYLQNKEQKSLS